MPFPPQLLEPPRCVSVSPDLRDEQRAALAVLVKHFGDEAFELPLTEGELATEPLSEREMMFLSQETLLRFLSATDLDVTEATERIERALVWRRTAGVDDIDAMAAEIDCEGKCIVQGFGPAGMPVMYFFPGRNTQPVDQRRVLHAVFMLERAIDLMSDGVTKVLVVFNFSEGKRQCQPTSVTIAKDTLHILSEYYPECLGLAVLQDMPFLMRSFANVFWPFIEPRTRDKIHVCTGSQAIGEGAVAPQFLLRECGGKLDLPYDHASYWPTLLETCRKRRADQYKRWRALGPPVVGRMEAHFKVAPPRTSVLKLPLTEKVSKASVQPVQSRYRSLRAMAGF